ncbi:wd repeat-containing protein [Anaeramoeba flamelloides]|uniref:Wd repeat-containing protein n=1 Tax=Anaeramoeba flamelloides TaxID=1746091 RepID=A0AAV7ZEK1_9EUKA|nr:wd repeat-containing protein [Anaeramoeba flamelloides]
MVKIYLKYQLSDYFGVVTTGLSTIYAGLGRHRCLVSGLETLYVINLKQSTILKEMRSSTSGITALCVSPDQKIAVTGHANGDLQVWSLVDYKLVCSLSGHHSSVRTINFRNDGSMFASGSDDTTIIVWDLLSQRGLFKLRSHRNVITKIQFTSKNHLVSSSKDKTVKVWDLSTQNCISTLVGHKDEVSSCTFDQKDQLIITGSKDQLVRVWSLAKKQKDLLNVGKKKNQGFETFSIQIKNSNKNEDGKKTDNSQLQSNQQKIEIENEKDEILSQVLEKQYAFLGGIERKSKGKIVSMKIDPNRKVLILITSGKQLEVFKIRTEEEIKSKWKKLKRKQRKRIQKFKEKQKEKEKFMKGNSNFNKNQKKKKNNTFQIEEEKEIEIEIEKENQNENENENENELQWNDQIKTQLTFVSLSLINLNSKVSGFSFLPVEKEKKNQTFKKKQKFEDNLPLLVSYRSNQLQIINISLSEKDEGAWENERLITERGHSTDIRSLSISEDQTMLATVASDSVRVWNLKTRNCIRTLYAGYALCCLWVPGDRHLIIGNKKGELYLFDVATAELIEKTQPHTDSIWSIELTPDKSGIITGSADHDVKFFDFELIEIDEENQQNEEEEMGNKSKKKNKKNKKKNKKKKKKKRLGIVHSKTLKMGDSILYAKFSPDGKFIGVSLLDCTIKIFYVDSLKFYLSLYGHKLPVLSFDFSSDSTLIATGSADKNIKIWGLDFGDCHRSIFAHDGNITGVKFVPNTHYLFSASKDNTIKYWDMDNYDCIQTLRSHHLDITALDINQNGSFVISASKDSSIRIWEKTEEQLFIEEEKENQMDELFEKSLIENHEKEIEMQLQMELQQGEGSTNEQNLNQSLNAGKRTLETVKGGEKLLSALEMSENELDNVKKAENPLMLGLSPADYMLKMIKSIHPNDLQEALLVVPFTSAIKLLSFINIWIKQQKEIELSLRCLFLILNTYQNQFISNKAAISLLTQLQKSSQFELLNLKNNIGFNIVALESLQEHIKNQDESLLFDYANLLEKKKKSKEPKKKMRRKNF